MTCPDMFTARQWDLWVDEGRTFVRAKTSAQFGLGDLTLQMVKHQPHDFKDHGVRDVLAAYADEVGLSASTLAGYRYVAHAWPRERRNEAVSFAIHRELAAHSSRFRLINEPPLDPVSKQRRWTVNEAQRAAGHTPKHAVTAQERVDKVRDLIADDEDAAVVVREVLNRPAVVQKVMKDSSARHILKRASRTGPTASAVLDDPEDPIDTDSDEAVDEAPEPEKRERPPRRPKQTKVHYSEAPHEVLELLGVCTAFYSQTQRLIPHLHVAEYDENTKHTLVESLGRVRAAADWAETVINTGDASMDERLAQLLQEES